MLRNRSPKYSTLNNDPTIQNIIARKYFDLKLNKNNNISSYNQKKTFQSPSPSNITIETEIDRSNESNQKNIKIRPEKYYPNTNKEYYEIGNYTQNQKDTMKHFNNIIRINLKPFIISTHKDDKSKNIQNIINKMNNSRNSENINNRSNYSYFESKYTNVDKKESNKNIFANNSNHSIVYSNDKDNKELNQTLNNLKQLTYKNLKNKYEILKSPIIKIEKDSYDKDKNPFNTFQSSSPNNRNIFLRNTGNIRPYKNKVIKTIIQQSRSPIIEYNKEKILKNTLEKREFSHINDKTKNTFENSLPKQSPNKDLLKKIKFVHPRHRTETSYQLFEDKSTENKIKPYNINSNKKSTFPTDKKDFQTNEISNDKKLNKNLIRVSIRNKYKNLMQNLHFNINAKPKMQEHYKRNMELLNKSKDKNEIKNDKERTKEENNINSNNKENKLE